MLRNHFPSTAVPTKYEGQERRFESTFEQLANCWLASLSNMALTARLWLQRSRTRGRLAELDDHELIDIGIGRGQAQYESEKPFWRG
jgi:uncharacterized protein YjiS (DUF1127 family)